MLWPGQQCRLWNAEWVQITVSPSQLCRFQNSPWVRITDHTQSTVQVLKFTMGPDNWSHPVNCAGYEQHHESRWLVLPSQLYWLRKPSWVQITISPSQLCRLWNAAWAQITGPTQSTVQFIKCSMVPGNWFHPLHCANYKTQHGSR